MYCESEGGAFNEQVATFQVMKIGSTFKKNIFSGNRFNKAVVMKMLLKKSERHILCSHSQSTTGTSICSANAFFNITYP